MSVDDGSDAGAEVYLLDGPEDGVNEMQRVTMAPNGICFESQAFEVSFFVMEKSTIASNTDANPVIYRRTFDLTSALRWRLLLSSIS
jgi:hypothetical protein